MSYFTEVRPVGPNGQKDRVDDCVQSPKSCITVLMIIVRGSVRCSADCDLLYLVAPSLS